MGTDKSFDRSLGDHMAGSGLRAVGGAAIAGMSTGATPRWMCVLYAGHPRLISHPSREASVRQASASQES